MGSSALTATAVWDRQKGMLQERPGHPELAWFLFLKSGLVGGQAEGGLWVTQAAESGPGPCCPHRGESVGLATSEKGGQFPIQTD